MSHNLRLSSNWYHLRLVFLQHKSPTPPFYTKCSQGSVLINSEHRVFSPARLLDESRVEVEVGGMSFWVSEPFWGRPGPSRVCACTLVDLVAKELLAWALEWAELKEMEEEGGDLALAFYTQNPFSRDTVHDHIPACFLCVGFIKLSRHGPVFPSGLHYYTAVASLCSQMVFFVNFWTKFKYQCKKWILVFCVFTIKMAETVGQSRPWISQWTVISSYSSCKVSSVCYRHATV